MSSCILSNICCPCFRSFASLPSSNIQRAAAGTAEAERPGGVPSGLPPGKRVVNNKITIKININNNKNNNLGPVTR
jgi:hypothetical protein